MPSIEPNVHHQIREAQDHRALVLRAEGWLRRNCGCGVVIRDPFRARTNTGEQPDAIGWRDGVSILVECKVSRADFLADRNKPFRRDPSLGLGDWRFMMCPSGLIQVEDLSARWGLLWVTGKTIQRVHGVPGNTGWWRDRPFVGCKASENAMLLSALRRMVLRGHFEEIYDGIPPR